MFIRFAALCVGTALLTSLPTFADACSRSVSKQAASTVVPSKSIDQSLLDSAIRVEVNFHRCRAGLGKVGDVGTNLSNQAQKHSQWMAKTQQLTHRSTVAGAATLRDRFKRAGVQFRTGSENIGMVHRYQIDNRRFKILDSGNCKFATYEGKPLPAHSYASLARHAVSLWMNSPGHRRNILDKSVRKVETAVAFDPNAQYCGRFWLTQNFVG